MFEIEASGTASGSRQVATQSFTKGQFIHRISDFRITQEPTFSSIQIGADAHIEDLGSIAYLNHSCRPTTFVDTGALTVHAVRDIAPGEELTFFYPSTEWDMDRPFDCLCGEPSCINRVAGAKHLPAAILNRFVLNQHVLELLRQSLSHRTT